jgi:SAM-dependent methyltransferase
VILFIIMTDELLQRLPAEILSHYGEGVDRLRALAEAGRVLRPEGHLFVAAISRFASLLDGLREYRLDDPAFVQIVERDLREGQHRNPENRPEWFTTAYFHHPDELVREVRDAGLILADVLAVEGPGWLLPEFDARWRDDRRRHELLEAIARIERERSMLGVSAHIVAVARHPDR